MQDHVFSEPSSACFTPMPHPELRPRQVQNAVLDRLPWEERRSGTHIDKPLTENWRVLTAHSPEGDGEVKTRGFSEFLVELCTIFFSPWRQIQKRKNKKIRYSMYPSPKLYDIPFPPPSTHTGPENQSKSGIYKIGCQKSVAGRRRRRGE